MMFQHHPRKCRNYENCGRIIYGHRLSGFCSLKCLREYHDIEIVENIEDYRFRWN